MRYTNPKRLSTSGADQFRPINGLVKGCDVERVIDFHLKKGSYLRWNDSLEVTRLSDFEYSIEKIKESNWGYIENEIILLKKVGDSIEIKCEQCDTTSSKLCHHQSSIFDADFIDSLRAIVNDEFASFDDTKKSLSRQIGIREDQFDLYFNILIDGLHQIAVGKEENLFSKSTIDNIVSDKLKLDFFSGADKEFKDRIEKEKDKSYAIAWTNNDWVALSGKSVKAKNKLGSKIKLIEPEEIFDGEFLDIVTKLLHHDLETELGQLQFLKFCQSNLGRISKQINYLSNFDLTYGVRKSDLKLLYIQSELVDIEVRVDKDDQVISIHPILKVGGLTIPMDKVLMFTFFMVVLKDHTTYFFKNPNTINILALTGPTESGLVLINPGPQVHVIYDVISKASEIHMEGMLKKVLCDGSQELYISQVGNFVLFEPVLMYEEEKFSILVETFKRDLEVKETVMADEDEVMTFRKHIQHLFPAFNIDTTVQRYFYIPIKQLYEDNWFLDLFKYCADHQITIFGQEKLEDFNFETKKASVKISFSSGIEWFNSEVDIAFGDLTVTTPQWMNAVKSGSKYVKLSNGKMGVLPEKWLKKLKRLSELGEVAKGGTININKLRFNALDDMFEDIDDNTLKEEIRIKKKAFADYDQNKTYVLPKGLKATLRPYQEQGYQWLKFLEEYNFGGCLADDMGLGKTVQVLALLLDQHHQGKSMNLVIVPRSLLFNWESEIEKFTPDLTYKIHHGVARDKSLEGLENYSIIITTYDTCVRDIEQFADKTFNYIILDESQAIKNVNSKRYKAMRLLRAENRLVMTGTPIENNTFDLYAQLSFVNPGLLGGVQYFKDQFSNKIDAGQGDEATYNILKSIIHPFMLRRTKDIVASDLPLKTETVIYCEMDKVQRSMYEKLRLKIKEDVEGVVLEQGVNKSKFKILEGLLRLRQMCNATHLSSNAIAKGKQKSVKIDVLIEQLQELGGNKALVFSQFVGMLQLVKERLENEGITYAYLDGSTRDRKGAVHEFSNNKDCQVFLISIKAGNTGLNLTQAEYVYILDPWWNPAVEAQAIDRTHRIGQQNPVFAYKMVCKDTIEEKIVKLQSKKKQLAKDLIQVDENIFKILAKDDLMALFD